MTPYLDLVTYKRRSRLLADYIDQVEISVPGFIAQAIEIESSPINAVLRKRYGNNGCATSLPFGQSPPALIASGTNPPQVTLQGRPALGALRMVLQVMAPGVTGVATFQWSEDGGVTWSGVGVVTAPFVALGATGLSAVFPPPPAMLGADNVWSASAPVPETILGWLTVRVDLAVLTKLGYTSSNEASVQFFREEAVRVRAEMKEAADGKDGLWDLPTNEDADSAVTTGGPLGMSDASPYAWTDRQVCEGREQDARRGYR